MLGAPQDGHGDPMEALWKPLRWAGLSLMSWSSSERASEAVAGWGRKGSSDWRGGRSVLGSKDSPAGDGLAVDWPRSSEHGTGHFEAQLGASVLLDAMVDQLAERVAERLADFRSPQVAASQEDEWFDSRHAAEYLGVHRDTLRKLAAERVIPTEQDGPNCKLYFRRSDLDSWRRSGGRPRHLTTALRRVA